MGIGFVKMVGAGNDFVVVDNRAEILGEEPDDFGRRVCARHFGVGADGVLLIEDSSTADFRMRIINADGSEAEMCGNGARCAARFAYVRKIAPRKMTFETIAGPIEAEVDAGRVTIGMGRVDPAGEPVKLQVDGHEWTVHPVEAGVPHGIIFVENLQQAPVEQVGRQVRFHPTFAPRGTNVDFVRVEGPGRISIRTYERGVEAETRACGTGSIASAVVSCARAGLEAPPVEVQVLGGVLGVDFCVRDGQATDVRLAGDAVFVYEGELC